MRDVAAAGEAVQAKANSAASAIRKVLLILLPKRPDRAIDANRVPSRRERYHAEIASLFSKTSEAGARPGGASLADSGNSCRVLPAINQKSTPSYYACFRTGPDSSWRVAQCGAPCVGRSIFARRKRRTTGPDGGGGVANRRRNRCAHSAPRRRRPGGTPAPRGQAWPPGTRCTGRA